MTEETHCPSCGLAYAMVGRAHNCRPRLVSTPKLMAAAVKEYASNRVFDGTRPLSPHRYDAVVEAVKSVEPKLEQLKRVSASKSSITQHFAKPCSNCSQLEVEVERLNARIKSLEVDIKLQVIDNKTIVVASGDRKVTTNGDGISLTNISHPNNSHLGDTNSVDISPNSLVTMELPEAAVAAIKNKTTQGLKMRGRPKITSPRPWELDGISRKTWYKRQKNGKDI